MSNNHDELRRTVLMIGGPDAGKSNFLARLWLALRLGDSALANSELPPDLEYLKTGASHLLKGEFAPHTSSDVHDQTPIPVKSSVGGKTLSWTLVVPDLSGEEILSIFRTRQWSEDWEGAIREGCGCLLFVRIDSDELIAPLDWVNCPINFGAPLPAVVPEKDTKNKAKTPTQVVLVDWLQFLRKAFTEKVGGEYKPRVGVVVAAWDRAPNEQSQAGPREWVTANLPLLSQYIEANDDEFEFTYFGVSVAEGDLKTDPEFKAAYLSGDPRRAGEVVHSLSGKVETSRDMTLPIAWALGTLDANEDRST